MCLAVPARVIEVVDAARHLVAVECDGAAQVVSLLWLVGANSTADEWVGAWVTINSGFATARIDADTAGMLGELFLPP